MATFIHGGGGSSTGTAKAGDVLEGKTFSNDDDSEIKGSMIDNDAITDIQSMVQNGGSLFARIPAGAHVKKATSGFPEVKTPLSNFGDAGADDVLSGKKFTSSAGLEATGSMPNRGNFQNAVKRETKAGFTNGYFYIHIPEGCYRANGTTWGPEARISKSDGNADHIWNDDDMNAKRAQGQQDVKNNPGGYGLEAGGSYNNGYANGKAQPKSGTHTISLDARPTSGKQGDYPNLTAIRIYIDGTQIWDVDIHTGQYNVGGKRFTVTN